MTTEGSYTGRLALVTLAADLEITPDALKIVLTEAFVYMHALQQRHRGPFSASSIRPTRLPN
jgi:hypothetical protein